MEQQSGAASSETSDAVDARLRVPFSFIGAGCSGSGKTSLVKFILLNQKYLLTQEFTKIFWLCRFAQKDLQKELGTLLPITFLTPGIIPEIEDIVSQCSAGDIGCLVIDDMMTQGASSSVVNELFVAGRHLNLSIFFLTQNLFSTGTYSRNIRLNTNYLAIFRPIHDRRQICYFIQQMTAISDDWKQIYEIFQNATASTYGYLLMDFKVETCNILKFRANITPHWHTAYKLL